MNKKWSIYTNENKEQIEKLEKELKINTLLATILANRDITTEKAKTFLNPTRHDFYNPFEMPDMEKAVNRIIQAIEKKEKVIIYGDYDVDGITSTIVLKSFLKERGLETGTYIPNRLKEGYGLNKQAIEKIANNNYQLIITVDCGITAIEEIEYAKSLQIETIVTDHHEPIEILPKAIAVVDCKRKENKYPFRELAGVGVAFKLIQAISIKLNLEEKEFLKYLDIVTIGTIADVVPLIDENRVISKLGLKLIEQTRNIGLKAILNQIGYKKQDATSISFGVAPRINACGRMGSSYKALELLLTTDTNKAIALTNEINEYNNKRKIEEQKIFEEAELQIKEKNLEKEEALILKGKKWHRGVIGIVASKITEKYYKPSILISYEEDDEIGKGSGRSISGFDLHMALMKTENMLAGFGGHSMAVGVSVKEQDFEEFKTKFLEIAKAEHVNELLPILNIDAILDIDKIDKQMVQSLSLLEPFGEGNKTPIFVFKNLKIDSIRTLTDGKHLKLGLKSNKHNYIDCIGFNLGYLALDYKIGDKINIAGNLDINSFNGIENIQITIKDIMKAI